MYTSRQKDRQIETDRFTQTDIDVELPINTKTDRHTHTQTDTQTYLRRQTGMSGGFHTPFSHRIL